MRASGPGDRLAVHSCTSPVAPDSSPRGSGADLAVDGVEEARQHLLGCSAEPDLAAVSAQGELLLLAVGDLQASPGEVLIPAYELQPGRHRKGKPVTKAGQGAQAVVVDGDPARSFERAKRGKGALVNVLDER